MINSTVFFVNKFLKVTPNHQIIIYKKKKPHNFFIVFYTASYFYRTAQNRNVICFQVSKVRSSLARVFMEEEPKGTITGNDIKPCRSHYY